MQTTTIKLSENWQFREFPLTARRMRDIDEKQWQNTKVPASIYTSLTDAGLIDKNDLLSNPQKYQWVSEKPWVYRCSFNADQETANAQRAELIFESLDTYSAIWLNEKLITRTHNMFIPHTVNVAGILQKGSNSLFIKFEPIIQHARRIMSRYTTFTSREFPNPCRAYARKAQYAFGSDNNPPLPGCGITGPVKLQTGSAAKIKNLWIRTIECDQHSADIRAQVEIQKPKDHNAQLKCKIQITAKPLNIEQTINLEPNQTSATVIFNIERPFLWHPKGYGIQFLYQASASLIESGRTIDTQTQKFGIRTVRIDRSESENSQSLRLIVNDQPFHAKGAIFTPPSVFPDQADENLYRQLLQAASDAGINFLRVRAEGLYENKTFYQICDQLGIMIWQDFPFHAAYYPDRQWFLNIIKKEAQTEICRLRNHPSLAIWCGNDRCDWLHRTNKLGKSKKFHGNTIYHRLLPDLLNELDPDREYIPTTPVGSKRDLNHPQNTTFHQEQVWKNHQPLSQLTDPENPPPNFLADFGFQSPPNAETLTTYCPPQTLRPGSANFEKFNYQPHGNSRLYRYTYDIFAPADQLETFTYISQLAHARVLKTYIEYLRANSKINAGIIPANLTDSCPAISPALLDFHRKPKTAYYYLRRAYQPISIIVTGIDPLEPGTILPSDFPQIIAINESQKPVTAEAVARVIEFNGKEIDRVRFPLTLPPFTISTPIRLPKALAKPQNPAKSLLHIALTIDDLAPKTEHSPPTRPLAENCYLFMPDKHLYYTRPHISAQLNRLNSSQFSMTLTARNFAKDVQIITDYPSKLNDNFIDLLPGIPKTIHLHAKTDMSEIQARTHIRSVNSVQLPISDTQSPQPQTPAAG